MTDNPITSFTGNYAFLSNFYPHPVEVDGNLYPTNEHAFQALKTDDPVERQKVREAKTPASAKSLGKRVTLREGWDTSRFEVMERLVRLKFSDADMAEKLLATGKRELIEGNTWRDTTWGCIMTKDGLWRGRNELGKILIRVRAELG
ncbi:MAG: NADAR family protein [Janthinobacterium lividum]